MFLHRKKRRLQGEVELNVTAMLDLAFQLLAFFILTFRPSPVEGDVVLRLPAALPTTVLPNAQPAGANEKNPNPVQGLTSLVITVVNDAAGGTKQIVIGDQVVAGLAEFENRLRAILGDAGTGFDQVLLQVGSDLNYEELMRVVDVCTRQRLADGSRLSKLSFVPLPSS
jgi:biopolymer transport protein ExbD